MAGTISEGKKADTDLVIYNDYPSLELDLRKPGINTGTTIYFNEGDSGYIQAFILIEDRQYEPAGYNASVSSLIATNIATGKTTTYSVDSSVNSGTNIGAFSVPNEITETAGAYECYLTFKSDKGNYSSPRWIYQVVSASNGTTIDLPEATVEQLENKFNGKISELRDNVVSLSNKIDHSVAIDTSDFIHAEQFNTYKTDTDTKIQSIKTKDEKQSNDIVTNKNNIAQNTSDISSLKSDMSSVKSDISTAQDNIKALQDKQPTDVSPDLTQIKSDLKSVQNDTKQNSKDIATLSADDSALQEKVADIQNTQSSHTSNITQLQSDIKSVQSTANSNKTDIDKNKTDIATTKQDIATINEKLATIGTGSSSSGDTKVPQQVIDDVAQNKTDIAKNKADIKTNSDNIATNTTDIATIKHSLSSDESQISTNTTNISQNEQDIANLKKSSKELSDKVANLPAPDDAALLKLHTIVDTNTHNISDNTQNITTINQKLAKMPTATDLANVTSTATDAKNTATEAKQQANDNATDIATLTDKVSKIKQPDLSDYAKKSDLPADNSAQVSKNTTDIATNKTNISQNTTDIATLTNKVNGIHLPDLSPYLKSSDAATTYLTTATASETYAKLTDIPADKSADIAKNKQDIATINDKIKTLVVPDLSSYLTKTAADSIYAQKVDIPDTSNFITTTDADKKYATIQQAHKESQDAMKYTAIMGAKLEGELSPVSQTATQASTQATTNAGDIYELQNDVSNLKANTPIPRKVTYDPKAPWTDTSFQNDCSILCTNPTSQYSAEVSGGNLYFTSMPGLIDLSDSDSGDTSKSNFAVGFKNNATDSSGNFYDTQQTITSDGTGKLYIHKVNNSSFDTYSRVNNIGIQSASYSYSSKILSLAIELAFAGNGLPAMLNGKTFNVFIEVRDTVDTDSASNSFSTTFMMKEASETSYYFGNNTVQLQNPYIYLDFDLSNSLLNGNLYLYSMTIN